MPAENQERVRVEPLVLVDTTDLPRDDWLNYRRRGIGGSDVAAILGVSPFRTARDIYYDKLGVVAVEPDESNWVPLEVGNLLEDLVARIFQKKTGYRVFKIKKMFYHPKHQFMLADVDYFVELPDGTIALLEIKTTNYNAKDNWWLDGREIVPVYYELQGRHYMAVMDYDRVFFCCLYGNTEDEVSRPHDIQPQYSACLNRSALSDLHPVPSVLREQNRQTLKDVFLCRLSHLTYRSFATKY